jgi:secreted PhoX family phosphatase
VPGSNYARRIDATTPHRLTGPAAGIDGGPDALGTFANCSGGRTPWGTALSCEENFHEVVDGTEFHYRWPREPYADRRHAGWVVEVDPFDPTSVPRKHTALGRCRHENVAIRVGADGTLAAYLGDDRNDACLYKFVAAGKVTGDRAKDRALLESGKLYVAQLDGAAPGTPASTTATRGRWLLLDLETQPALREAKRADGSPRFSSQGDVLADVAAAAQALGATPLERPEDAEIHPHDGSLFVALTNQKKRTPADWHGRIVRLAEAGGDPAALAFEWSVFAEGSAADGVSSPDNLAFDGRGDLWVTSDRSSDAPTQEQCKGRGNNGLYFVPTRGKDAGRAHLAAIGPVDCELTGPCFTPDGSTLFLSVQHPGETRESREKLTSHWPHGAASLPRSAVIAIRM